MRCGAPRAPCKRHRRSSSSFRFRFFSFFAFLSLSRHPIAHRRVFSLGRQRYYRSSPRAATGGGVRGGVEPLIRPIVEPIKYSSLIIVGRLSIHRGSPTRMNGPKDLPFRMAGYLREICSYSCRPVPPERAESIVS